MGLLMARKNKWLQPLRLLASALFPMADPLSSASRGGGDRSSLGFIASAITDGVIPTECCCRTALHHDFALRPSDIQRCALRTWCLWS